MIQKTVLEEIDNVIKETWLNNISKDYAEAYILKEDSLKSCLYYHMRRRLASLLKKHNLRIFTEFDFQELNFRADMVIAKVNPYTEEHLRASISNEDIIAIIELKYTCNGSDQTAKWIKHDISKIKKYLQNIKCQYYFAVIYEVECSVLNWMDKRSSNNWASGFVTELNAGYIDGEMQFEIHPYNGLNNQLKS